MKGLSNKEALEQLKKYGQNTVSKDDTTMLKVFLAQFTNPLIFLLIAAFAISLFLQNYLDAIITIIIIIVNSIIGFVQDYKSNEAYKKLKQLISSNATVLRNGEKVQIDKSYIVPEDIIFLKLGDIVPADCIILEENNLIVDESALTGESSQVYKTVNKNESVNDKTGILYSGSNIVKGTVTAKVFATGIKSKFGEISQLSISTKKKSEYETNLKKLSRDFILVSLFALGFIFISHLIFNKRDSLTTILLFTVAIAITIIPEALPVVANITLAQGALKLSKKKVVVKRSSAIEDLGNIDLICTDKTGTLTLNKLGIDYFESEIEKHEFLKYSYLSCNGSNDPIDICISNYLKVMEFKPIKLPEFTDIPFDPVKKASQRNFDDYEIIKGAPEHILALTNNDTKKMRDTIHENSHKGLRAISFAIKHKHSKTLSYIGTYFFFDEVKLDAADVIKRAEKRGVKIKIITGDSSEVSTFVGKQVKLIENESEVIEARLLHFDDEKKLREEVTTYTIFARCDPVQKYKIIAALQEKHFVGYMGDGINDAPSLKLANVSIVVDTATDIAKANSDIILLSHSLEAIVDGIVEGRKMFENIDKYIKQTLVGNFGGFFTIGVMSLFMDFLPMLPVQILLNNLLTDLPGLAIATDNVDKDDIKKPEAHNIKLLIKFTILFGLFSSIFDVIFFVLAKGTTPQIQTQWFAFSGFTELFVLFSLRSRRLVIDPKSSRPSNNLIILVFVACIIISFLALVGIGTEFTPIGVPAFAFVIALSLVYAAVNEIAKAGVIWYAKRKKNIILP